MELKTIFERALERAQELEDEVKEREAYLNTHRNDYSSDALRAKHDQISALRIEIRHVMAEMRKAVDSECRRIQDDIDAAEAMDGSQLDEGDMRLLTCGVPMTDSDMRRMWDKHVTAGNSTMQRLVLRYCQQHNIDTTGMLYTGTAETAKKQRTIALYADVAGRMENHCTYSYGVKTASDFYNRMKPMMFPDADGSQDGSGDAAED